MRAMPPHRPSRRAWRIASPQRNAADSTRPDYALAGGRQGAAALGAGSRHVIFDDGWAELGRARH
jgi:hypothetical protein